MNPKDPNGPGPVDVSRSPAAHLRTLPLAAVELTGGLFGQLQDTNAQAALWHGREMLEAAGNLDNLRAAAQGGGTFRGPVFMDSDVYKWLEAASWELARSPNQRLRDVVEEMTDLVAASQVDDGYLDSYYTVAEPGRRWSDLPQGHELYCAGHLAQAAVAASRAGVSERLLEIADRLVAHTAERFGPDGEPAVGGHPEIEMALIELFRTTRNPRDLELGKIFIDRRGHGLLGRGRFRDANYFQDQQPVRDSHEIVGHAVRATYLASGVTDLYLETGEEALLQAMRDQWRDMTERKAYVTGALGSRYYWEGFGLPYELPNDACYGETCAAIGALMWSWRMLLATGESRFADWIEHSLYNAVLSGFARDGRSFFYVNPLSSNGASREPWYEVACCPPNLMRVIATLGHFVATARDDSLQVHQFGPSRISARLDSVGAVDLEVSTRYPWEGTIELRVTDSPERRWRLELRAPAWAPSATVRVNGVDETGEPHGGYLSVERNWRPGDTVQLELPMATERLAADPRIEAARDSVAIRRGPLVYCLEQADQPVDVNVLAVQASREPHFEATWRDEGGLGRVQVRLDGYAEDLADWAGSPYRPFGRSPSLQPARLTAIPYFLWANRDPGPMRVWLPLADPKTANQT